MKDLIIVGGGPAAVAAGVYASRKKLETTLVAESFGGQSNVSDSIENWIGTVSITGPDLARAMEAHLAAYAAPSVEIWKGERATGIEAVEGGFRLAAKSGKTVEAKAVLVATGSARRKLDAPGADKFEHKGVTYCASCDGPIFSGKDVVVIGGGNAGFETAAQLLAYAKSVTLLHRGPDFKADPVTVEAVLKNPKMRAIKNAQTQEVIGEKFVSGLRYKDSVSGTEETVPVQGIFVEVGAMPATDFVGALVERNDFGQIKVDPKTQRASRLGIWAAGDCTDGLYHQNNIAAGDAVKALEDLYLWVKAR
ncbi:MAG TPA: FAD-dependent oxidoreductase [Candidatus Paceibacterota bacterium]